MRVRVCKPVGLDVFGKMFVVYNTTISQSKICLSRSKNDYVETEGQ